LAISSAVSRAETESADAGHVHATASAGRNYTPVVTPNGRTLSFRMVGGVKVFHLIAEEVRHEFAPGLKARCWSYNGAVHGPTIEAVEGDQVRIYVTNRLPAPTSVHWHGLILPAGMDGVSGLTQPPIPPGETFRYEFTLRQNGTFMYHSHHDAMTQEGMGLTGLFVIHPKYAFTPTVDRDFAIMLHEWRIDPGTERPNTLEMTDFNVLTMNGKVFPATEPLVVRLGQRVRIRFANLSAQDHHPIHLHGFEFFQTAVDGDRIPESRQVRKVTTLVGVGETRDIEFVADNPGDWIFHCHMTHHTMNQMGHDFPNMVGVSPGGLERQIAVLLPGYMTMGETGMGDMMHMPIPKNSISMRKVDGPFGAKVMLGGMASVVKVRANIRNYEDPGWYRHPKGTVASRASVDELRRDGIKI
jgi:FtsP/CotA-like multicopper oxidase with cupredoxin domain